MQLKSIINLIDDDEEKEKGLTSIIDLIPKEEVEPQKPIKNIHRKTQVLYQPYKKY